MAVGPNLVMPTQFTLCIMPRSEIGGYTPLNSFQSLAEFDFNQTSTEAFRNLILGLGIRDYLIVEGVVNCQSDNLKPHSRWWFTTSSVT